MQPGTPGSILLHTCYCTLGSDGLMYIQLFDSLAENDIHCLHSLVNETFYSSERTKNRIIYLHTCDHAIQCLSVSFIISDALDALYNFFALLQ